VVGDVGIVCLFVVGGVGLCDCVYYFGICCGWVFFDLFIGGGVDDCVFVYLWFLWVRGWVWVRGVCGW